MLSRFAELQLTEEAIGVLKDAGIADLNGLAEASVTEIQAQFIAAAKDGRYPDKFPSLVKIAAWVEQARTLAQKQPEGGPSTDLDNIPTAVVKPTSKTKRAYPGSGAQAHVRKVELRPTRHRPKRQPEETPQTTGERVTLTPRAEHGETGDAVEELNPDHQRALHKRRPAPTLMPSPAPAPATADPTPAAPEETPPQPSGDAPQVNPPIEEATASPAAPAEPVAPTTPAIAEDDATPFKSFDDYKQGRVRVKPLDRHSLKVGEDSDRSTSTEQESFEEELVYKKRMPIWRIRGVKHPDGMKVYLGAFITFMAVFLTLALAIGAAVFPIYLEDKRLEFAGLFLATVFFWGLYIITAIGMRCRVCSCHLFYSRRCLKNVKAHRILGGFPMVAQTIHILCWRWFRCMYCGTAVRLRAEK